MQYSVLGLLILILDIWVILQIWKGGGDPAKKLLWTILVLLLPLIGPILYLVVGKQA